MWNEAGLLMVAAMLWLGSVTDADETCRCASCGAAICRAACRTDCNKCCRCCIYFEMRVGRRAISRQLHDPELPKTGGVLPGQRRSRLVGVSLVALSQCCSPTTTDNRHNDETAVKYRRNTKNITIEECFNRSNNFLNLL